MNPADLFTAHEASLAPLDVLPRALWLGGMTNAKGLPGQRLADLQTWRTRLLSGQTPSDETGLWPGGTLARSITSVMLTLKLPDFCQGSETVTDLLLQSLLFHTDLVVDYQDRGDTRLAAEQRVVSAFEADWRDRSGQIQELVEVLGDAEEWIKHCHWDILRGVLRSEAWDEMLRIRRFIERLPELSAIIRKLGRAQAATDTETSMATMAQMVPGQAGLARQASSQAVPDLPGQTRGVHRSDRVSRMLPAEAVLLRHPRLRLVWHARRAERALLAFEDDDHQAVSVFDTQPVWVPRQMPAPRQDLGPMLVCVDTSGSMRGAAVNVAKAVVLEAARVAITQRRPCHVFAFGGDDELIELTIAPGCADLPALVRFLSSGFHAGTDICGPIESVLNRLADEHWSMADLMLATDGEFGATPGLAERLAQTREQQGLRVQGVLIGDRETVGLIELCDHIHWVRDWRRFGGSASESPVHAASLTADYFPGALRGSAQRQATLSASEASGIVRAGGRQIASPVGGQRS